MRTGNAHLLIGAAFADDGSALPLGNASAGSAGNIRHYRIARKKPWHRLGDFLILFAHGWDYTDYG
jgi:hypothetical protein